MLIYLFYCVVFKCSCFLFLFKVVCFVPQQCDCDLFWLVCLRLCHFRMAELHGLGVIFVKFREIQPLFQVYSLLLSSFETPITCKFSLENIPQVTDTLSAAVLFCFEYFFSLCFILEETDELSSSLLIFVFQCLVYIVSHVCIWMCVCVCIIFLKNIYIFNSRIFIHFILSFHFSSEIHYLTIRSTFSYNLKNIF